MGTGAGWWESVNVAVVGRWASAERPEQFLDHLAQSYPRFSYKTRREGQALRVISRGKGRMVIGDVSASRSSAGTSITTRVESPAPSMVRSVAVSAAVTLVGVGLLVSGTAFSFPLFGPLGSGDAVPFLTYFAGMATALGLVTMLALPSMQESQVRRLNRGLVRAGATYLAEPGWYADPDAPARDRWWDGNTWTDRRQEASDDRATARRRVVRARWLPLALFFFVFFGVPLLLIRLNQRTIPVQAVIPVKVRNSFPDARSRSEYAATLANAAEARLSGISNASVYDFSVTANPPGCTGCTQPWRLEVRAPHPLDPAAAALALGPGHLSVRPVVTVAAPCAGASLRWIAGSDHGNGCVAAVPSIRTVVPIRAVGDPPLPRIAALPASKAIAAQGHPVDLTLNAIDAIALADWSRANPGVDAAFVLDGRVVAVVANATLARLSGIDTDVFTAPMHGWTGMAVAGAASGPPFPPG